jgi:hypothetical protein
MDKFLFQTTGKWESRVGKALVVFEATREQKAGPRILAIKAVYVREYCIIIIIIILMRYRPIYIYIYIYILGRRKGFTNVKTPVRKEQ